MPPRSGLGSCFPPTMSLLSVLLGLLRLESFVPFSQLLFPCSFSSFFNTSCPSGFFLLLRRVFFVAAVGAVLSSLEAEAACLSSSTSLPWGSAAGSPCLSFFFVVPSLFYRVGAGSFFVPVLSLLSQVPSGKGGPCLLARSSSSLSSVFCSFGFTSLFALWILFPVPLFLLLLLGLLC